MDVKMTMIELYFTHYFFYAIHQLDTLIVSHETVMTFNYNFLATTYVDS